MLIGKSQCNSPSHSTAIASASRRKNDGLDDELIEDPGSASKDGREEYEGEWESRESVLRRVEREGKSVRVMVLPRHQHSPKH